MHKSICTRDQSDSYELLSDYQSRQELHMLPSIVGKPTSSPTIVTGVTRAGCFAVSLGLRCPIVGVNIGNVTAIYFRLLDCDNPQRLNLQHSVPYSMPPAMNPN